MGLLEKVPQSEAVHSRWNSMSSERKDQSEDNIDSEEATHARSQG
jgi:hypothetical protein